MTLEQAEALDIETCTQWLDFMATRIEAISVLVNRGRLHGNDDMEIKAAACGRQLLSLASDLHRRANVT